MDHLAGMLKRGGIRDLHVFFPTNKRSDSVLDAHFRGAGLPQVADWWTRKQNARIKEEVTKAIKEALERDDQPSDVRPNSFSPPFFPFYFALEFAEDTVKQVVAAVHAVIEERPLPEAELVASLWQGL